MPTFKYIDLLSDLEAFDQNEVNLKNTDNPDDVTTSLDLANMLAALVGVAGDFELIGKEIPSSAGLVAGGLSLIADIGEYNEDVSEANSDGAYGDLFLISSDMSPIVASTALLIAPEFAVPLVVFGLVANALGNYLKNHHKKSPDDPIPGNPPKKPSPGLPLSAPTPHDPLVLDLAGSGISLTALEGSPAKFDYANSGFAIQTGWISAGQGLLVTRPADGATVTASNLLGAQSGNGFQDLAALDANGDGVINASDPGFSTLRVWIDAAGDGQSSAGELYTLHDLGIVSISLNTTGAGYSAAGNLVVSSAVFQMRNSTSGQLENHGIYEVNFNTNRQITSSGTATGEVYSDEAIKLPDLSGYGLMHDLGAAMSSDPNLLQAVQDLVINSASMTADDFNVAFQKMVMIWAGSDNIDPNSAGGFIDARKLAVIYSFYGIDPSTDSTYSVLPNWHNSGLIWQPLYDKIIASLETRFISQISSSLVNLGASAADLQSNPYTAFAGLRWDASTDRFTGNFQQVFQMAKLLAPTDTAAATAFWNQVIPALSYLGMDVTAGPTGESAAQQLLAYASVAQLPHDALSELSNMLVGRDVVSTSSSGSTVSLATRDNLVVIDTSSANLNLAGGDVFVATKIVQEINWGENVFQSDLVLSNVNRSDVRNYVVDQISGSLTIGYGDGTSLKVNNFFNSDGTVNVGEIYFADGSSMTAFQLLTVAESQEEAGLASSFAAGGYLKGTVANDVLTGSSASYLPSPEKALTEFTSPVSADVHFTATSTAPVRTDVIDPISAVRYDDQNMTMLADYGTLTVNGGKGDDVFIPGVANNNSSLGSNVENNEIIYNLGDGDDVIVMPGTSYDGVTAQGVGKRGLRAGAVDDSNCLWPHPHFMS